MKFSEAEFAVTIRAIASVFGIQGSLQECWPWFWIFEKIPKNTRFSRNSCLNKVMHTGSNFEIFAPAAIHCFTFCTLFEDFSGLDSWLKTFYRIYHSLHDHSNGNARRRKWCNRNEKIILNENVLYRIKRWSLYSKSMHFG